MKGEQFVVHRRSAGVNDYEFELTVPGVERARRLFEQATYFGTAPVSLEDYTRSIVQQAPGRERPTTQSLQKALGDLLVNP